MKKTPTNKKILYVGIVIILLIIVIGIFVVNSKKQNEENYTTPRPEEVVRQYFTAWNNKNYPDMYATISDGFKRIDPNAKDLAAFRNFANSQGVGGINILNIKLESMTMDGKPVDKKMFGMPGMEAVVDYRVEFILGGGNEAHENTDQKRDFNGTFTLKYRQGDIIPGWKLIHPYGNNIDTS